MDQIEVSSGKKGVLEHDFVEPHVIVKKDVNNVTQETKDEGAM